MCPWAEKCHAMHVILVVLLSGFPTNKFPMCLGIHPQETRGTICGSAIKPEPSERRLEGIPLSLKEKQRNKRGPLN